MYRSVGSLEASIPARSYWTMRPRFRLASSRTKIGSSIEMIDSNEERNALCDELHVVNGCPYLRFGSDFESIYSFS